jgi:hypothetical protein
MADNFLNTTVVPNAATGTYNLLRDKKKTTYDEGSDKYIFGTGDGSVEFTAQDLTPDTPDEAATQKIQKLYSANPIYRNTFGDFSNFYKSMQEDRASRKPTPLAAETPVLEVNKPVTAETEDSAKKTLEDYYNALMTSADVDVGKDALTFLSDPGAGLTPANLKHASSLFGTKIDGGGKAGLAALGGLLSGLAGDTAVSGVPGVSVAKNIKAGQVFSEKELIERKEKAEKELRDRTEKAMERKEKIEEKKLEADLKRVENEEKKKVETAKTQTDIIKIAQQWADDFAKSAEVTRANEQLLNYNTLAALPTDKELTGPAVTAAIKSFAKIILPKEAVMSGDEDAIVRAMMQKPKQEGDDKILSLINPADWVVINKWVQANLTGNTIPAAGLRDMKSIAENAIFSEKNMRPYQQRRATYENLINKLNTVNNLGENGIQPVDILFDPFGDVYSKIKPGSTITLEGVTDSKEEKISVPLDEKIDTAKYYYYKKGSTDILGTEEIKALSPEDRAGLEKEKK